MSIISDKDDVDIQTVEVTSFDQESVEMEERAKLVAETLSSIYPNHMWMVGWAPGAVLIVKHGLGDSRYGYTIDNAAICSHKDLFRSVVQAGGELLERMGLPRRAWNGEDQATQYQM
jgi:hypothetical protein